jgi:LmbE family N-acetylglucosaminyl deacetylase
MSKPTLLFVSPHLDDVALSCGGLIRRLTQANNSVVVATVFTADVPAQTTLSWLTRRNHAAWRLGDSPFAARRCEDIVAVRILGAGYVHLNLHDAMYRIDELGHPFYRERIVNVPLDAEDVRAQMPLLQKDLKLVLASLGQVSPQVYCPLGAGGHVDHILVRRAVESICEPGRIVYYEDFPYAAQPDAVRSLVDQSVNKDAWSFRTINLSADEIRSRIEAISAYTSQLGGLFPSTMDRLLEILHARLGLFGRFDRPPNQVAVRRRMTASLQSYIAGVGGERYWQSSN